MRTNEDELWHVTDVPSDRLESGMATIVEMVDSPEDGYHMPFDAYIDEAGFLRKLGRGADEYIPKEQRFGLRD